MGQGPVRVISKFSLPPRPAVSFDEGQVFAPAILMTKVSFDPSKNTVWDLEVLTPNCAMPEYFDVCYYKSNLVHVRCPEPELEEQVLSMLPTMKIFLLLLERPFTDLATTALYTGNEAGRLHYSDFVHCCHTCRRWNRGVHLAMVAAVAVDRGCKDEIIDRFIVRRSGGTRYDGGELVGQKSISRLRRYVRRAKTLQQNQTLAI